PSRDAAAFAGAVLRYRGDRALLAAASESAARYTDQTFSWAGVADRFVEVFRERTGGPAAEPARAVGAR
ncbi:MAG TPA: hypothetical protein VFJ16_18750, partial [Longimicrobium sp.]|nr:hypothetical protein [Longimicrobium sp.]